MNPQSVFTQTQKQVQLVMSSKARRQKSIDGTQWLLSTARTDSRVTEGNASGTLTLVLFDAWGHAVMVGTEEENRRVPKFLLSWLICSSITSVHCLESWDLLTCFGWTPIARLPCREQSDLLPSYWYKFYVNPSTRLPSSLGLAVGPTMQSEGWQPGGRAHIEWVPRQW